MSQCVRCSHPDYDHALADDGATRAGRCDRDDCGCNAFTSEAASKPAKPARRGKKPAGEPYVAWPDRDPEGYEQAVAEVKAGAKVSEAIEARGLDYDADVFEPDPPAALAKPAESAADGKRKKKPGPVRPEGPDAIREHTLARLDRKGPQNYAQLARWGKTSLEIGELEPVLLELVRAGHIRAIRGQFMVCTDAIRHSQKRTG